VKIPLVSSPPLSSRISTGSPFEETFAHYSHSFLVEDLGFIRQHQTHSTFTANETTLKTFVLTRARLGPWASVTTRSVRSNAFVWRNGHFYFLPRLETFASTTLTRETLDAQEKLASELLSVFNRIFRPYTFCLIPTPDFCFFFCFLPTFAFYSSHSLGSINRVNIAGYYTQLYTAF